MKTGFQPSFLAAVLLLAGSAKTISGQDREYPLRIHVNVKVPLRDGVHLSADIYRPFTPTTSKEFWQPERSGLPALPPSPAGSESS